MHNQARPEKKPQGHGRVGTGMGVGGGEALRNREGKRIGGMKADKAPWG